MDQILNEKYLTMIIKQNGECTIGFLSMLERNMGQTTGWYAISVSGEIVSVVISGDDYRIPKNPTQQEVLKQQHYLAQYGNQVNKKATEIANLWDRDCNNYIVGNCAFVFDTQTSFTESKLYELMKK